MSPRRIAAGAGALIVVVALAWWIGRRQRDDAPTARRATVAEERCLDCHAETTGFSPFHDPVAIGCTSCHLGVAADTTEDGAHLGMVAVPGNLDDAAETCGSCHGETVARVENSLMATARGIVNVNRFVFGERSTPDGHDGMANLGDSHADEHLRQLCQTCHLGYPKTEPGPVTERSRGGGCLACHLTYDADTTVTHPRLTVAVSDDHCFGCHSRSGRISLNYAGWHETLLAASDVARVGEGERGAPSASDDTVTASDLAAVHRFLEDGRVVVRREADVHHMAGMACIDCHTARETMGDGNVYAHQEEATEIRCETCHFAGAPSVVYGAALDAESQRVLAVRHQTTFPERQFVRIATTGNALVNVFLDEEGTPVLEGKLDGVRRPLKPPVDDCTRPGHERLTCESCHAAWVPQCIGCHTQFDRAGQWQEFASDFESDAPVLGVRRDARSGLDRIQPFAPGMVLTINRNPADVSQPVATLAAAGDFRRLYAPQSPHTTQRTGRSCVSCHLDPLALGYGRGVLRISETDPPQWIFEPAYAPLRDGLPADAWVPFRQTRASGAATRTSARPLDRAEQERVLRVGACLTCHEPVAPNSDPIFDQFEEALRRMTASCRLPVAAE